MKKILFGLMTVALAVAPAFAQDAEKPKRKMPSSPKYFTSIKAATKEAQKYDAPIFVAVVGKGTSAEEAVKKYVYVEGNQCFCAKNDRSDNDEKTDEMHVWDGFHQLFRGEHQGAKHGKDAHFCQRNCRGAPRCVFIFHKPARSFRRL